MTNPVVNVNAQQQVAPQPSALQKSGALVSCGGTITSQGTYSLLTQLADLTPLLVGAAAITSLAWSGGVVTATTTAPHGLVTGTNVTIAGAAPAGYNGTFPVTVTGASTFTYALAANPGAETAPGTWVPEQVASLTQRATTFFGQGSTQAVWVLELGYGPASTCVSFLSTWITANPGIFYSYLVPRFWDAVSQYLTFLAGFEAVTSKTYFYTTTTLATYKAYTAQMKCVQALIEAPAYGVWPANALTAISWSGGVVTASTTTNHGVLPGQWFQIAGCTPTGYNGWFQALLGTTGTTILYALATNPGAESVLGTLVQSQFASAGVPATEFSCAAPFWATLNSKPSSTNKVPPLNNRFLSGVTPFPTQGNAALLATLNAANINVVGTGSAGGISEATLIGGNMMDGKPWNYWYAVDWVQVNAQLNLNAYVINGANSTINPVDYDQDGINGGQQNITSTMSTGISAGLVLNPIKQTQLGAQAYQAALDAGTYRGYTVVNADPFASYTEENPSDYANGVYNGYAITFTPLRGFASITINITASNFA